MRLVLKVEARRMTPVDLVAFVEQQLRQVGPVLPGDAG